MKKILFGAMIAMMASVVISCEKKPQEPEAVKLATPSLSVSNQTDSSFTVTWSAVSNAASYVYVFNGGSETSTGDLSVDFTELEAGSYEVKVKAIGDGVKYLDSEWASISVTLEAADDPGDGELDITGVYNIGGSDLNYEITYDEGSGVYQVWNPYVTGEGAYITATREGNTLVIGLGGIPEVNVGDPHGSVTVIMCAYHEDPSDGKTYLWPEESCVWEFTASDVTLTNGMFFGFQSPADQKWYNWQDSVQPAGTVGEKVESGSSSAAAAPSIASATLSGVVAR